MRERWKPLKFRADNLGMKKSTEIHFSKDNSNFTQNINIIYNENQNFQNLPGPECNFLNFLPTEKKICQDCHKKFLSRFFFHFRTATWEKFLTRNITQWKYYTSSLQILVSKWLSHTKMLEKVFLIYLIALSDIIEQNLIHSPRYIS